MWRLRIKHEHRPVRYGNGRIQIGGIIPGIDSHIMDPDGSVWALMEALDGMRPVAEVVADVRRRYPHRTPAEIRAGIDALLRAGYLEDADESTPEELTHSERERYGRSRALFRWMDRAPRTTSWQAQMLLRQARVTVVGVGGVGSTAALALVLSGVGHLHCVEPDVVELSNLNRQILFTESDVGRRKIEVALERLHAHNSEVGVTGEQRRIDGPDALVELAADSDVLLLAADQPQEIRSWVNRVCHQIGTAWVHGGYHGPQINIGLYRPGTGPCYDCAYTAERDRRAQLSTATSWSARSPGAVPQAANAVTAGIAGHLTAHAVISLITGAPPLRINCQYGLNLVTLQDCYVLGPSTPVPGCPTCGGVGGD